MKLHIPRGMKTKVIFAFVVTCTHEVYVECDIAMLSGTVIRGNPNTPKHGW
jgi:hypothetical protein